MSKFRNKLDSRRLGIKNFSHPRTGDKQFFKFGYMIKEKDKREKNLHLLEKVKNKVIW